MQVSLFMVNHLAYMSSGRRKAGERMTQCKPGTPAKVLRRKWDFEVGL